MASGGIFHPLFKRINYEEAVATKFRNECTLAVQMYCHPSGQLSPSEGFHIADYCTDWITDAFTSHSVWWLRPRNYNMYRARLKLLSQFPGAPCTQGVVSYDVGGGMRELVCFVRIAPFSIIAFAHL